VVSSIPDPPLASVYNDYSDLKIEIPSQKVNVDIVGVPLVDGEWDITWLGSNAGYLNGTAFPTWQGNSVITGHVYLSNGLPGPFVNLGRLKWGDEITIHAFGQSYIYSVRSVQTVDPDDISVLGHKDRSWITLLTCEEYDSQAGAYKKRIAVQAVLMSITADATTLQGGR
jgi:LPXTG-site transpeptidase (sortase) family protein